MSSRGIQDASRLKASIYARNNANDYVNNTMPQMLEIFRPLVGEKIVRNDGTLMERYKKLLPPFASVPGRFNVWQRTSGYRLSWCVTVTVSFDDGSSFSGSEQCESTLNVGKLENGRLTDLYEFDKLRSDYSYNEVIALREAAAAARKVYDDAAGLCSPFGE